MQKNIPAQPAWWQLARRQQLQPLSDEFLSRSPLQVPAHSWRSLPQGERHA